MARPCGYTTEIGERICEAIATTPRGLDFICAQEADFPAAGTAHRWLNQQPEFRESYLRARERQADLLGDEALEIADDTSRDTKVVGEDEREVLNAEWVARSKLRIDTRLRLAGKLHPKKWGDRIQHANDPENPLPGAVDLTALVERVARAAEAAERDAKG